MKKLTALILLICMLISLTACKKPKENNETPGTQNTTTETTPPESGNPGEFNPTIVVPEYKDYGRGSVDFSNIIYTRPAITALSDNFKAVADTVTEGTENIEEQLEKIRALETPLANVKTMYALVEISKSKDSSNEFWRGEGEYFGTYYPLLTQAVENLIVACAKSANKERFESDYFGYSLDEYVSGGIYTDEVVLLLQREATLETEYSSLSTATVEISYQRTGVAEPFEGTVDEVKAQLKEYFGNNTKGYSDVLPHINTLYTQALNKKTIPIYVELVKVRRSIADSLGYSSYTELAYEALGYSYTADEILTLLTDIGEYIPEVSSELWTNVFGEYFRTQATPTANSTLLINNLYEVYSKLGGNYKDAFSYMLQHGLYDVSASKENRFDGAFTTYLETNNSPYVFVTTSGFIRDYGVVAHEFGHFLDAFVNYGKEDSLVAMEVSSQALELLTVLSLKGTLYTSDHKYLEYYTVYSFLKDVLLKQSFYAAFEHLVYSLEYSEISEARLEELVDEAYGMIFGAESQSNLSDVIITHTVLSPCYVESYVTSAFISLDILFAEKSVSGDGFRLYEALIDRDGDISFDERLAAAGIESPFTEGKAMDTANKLYHYLTGKDYYGTDGGIDNAA